MIKMCNLLLALICVQYYVGVWKMWSFTGKYRQDIKKCNSHS